jgi:hypothetical protein
MTCGAIFNFLVMLSDAQAVALAQEVSSYVLQE